MSRPTPSASSNVSAQPARGGARRLHGFALGSVLAALMLTLLLEALDQTIVSTALPRIIGELQGFDRYTWVVTAYLLASTTVIPLVGKASDQFGRKWFFVVGVVIFLLGSALSGAAQTMNALIAFRALQGLGAGVGISLVFTVVGDIFTPAERARWQGLFAGVYGLSSVFGPTIGGYLTDHGPLLGTLVTNSTRWRWIFYINLPLGMIALVVLLTYLPTRLSVRTNEYSGWAAVRRIDVAGALLSSAATICLLLGLTWGGDQTYAWNSPQVVGALVAAALLFVVFYFVERVAVEPILPLALFRSRVFTPAALLSIGIGAILLSLVIYLPLFIQGVLKQSASVSGTVITPLTVSFVIGATLSGVLVSRLGRYQIITVLGSVALVIGVFLMTRMTAATSLLEVSRNMVIAGVGLGVFLPLLTLAVQNAIPRAQLGVGTAAIRYLQAAGQTLGLAIVGSVVNSTVSAELAQRLPSDAQRTLTSAGVAAATNQQVLVSADYHDALFARSIAEARLHGVPGVTQQILVRAAAQHTPITTEQAAALAVTQVTDNTIRLLNAVIDALRAAEAVAIQRGLLVVLGICVAVFVCTLFFKDLPLARTFQGQGGEGATTTAPTAPADHDVSAAPIL